MSDMNYGIEKPGTNTGTRRLPVSDGACGYFRPILSRNCAAWWSAAARIRG